MPILAAAPGLEGAPSLLGRPLPAPIVEFRPKRARGARCVWASPARAMRRAEADRIVGKHASRKGWRPSVISSTIGARRPARPAAPRAAASRSLKPGLACGPDRHTAPRWDACARNRSCAKDLRHLQAPLYLAQRSGKSLGGGRYCSRACRAARPGTAAHGYGLRGGIPAAGRLGNHDRYPRLSRIAGTDSAGFRHGPRRRRPGAPLAVDGQPAIAPRWKSRFCRLGAREPVRLRRTAFCPQAMPAPRSGRWPSVPRACGYADLLSAACDRGPPVWRRFSALAAKTRAGHQLTRTSPEAGFIRRNRGVRNPHPDRSGKRRSTPMPDLRRGLDRGERVPAGALDGVQTCPPAGPTAPSAPAPGACWACRRTCCLPPGRLCRGRDRQAAGLISRRRLRAAPGSPCGKRA